MGRALVRAALAYLQSEGLVDAPARRTATTAKPTLEEAKEVFEVRRTLEREVVRLVIARWRPGFGAELERHVRGAERARHARPHAADCAVNEHREIVAALRSRNAEAAIAVMDHHLGSVEHRALLDQDRDAQFDLGAVLSRYAET